MKIAAFGRTSWLYDSIKALAANGHEIALIGTCPAAKEYSKDEKDFARLAKSLGCPYFCSSSINDVKYVNMAKRSGAEAAISVNWLINIGKEMIGQFPRGIINAHGGDLPRFRGNACANWAILAGEKKIVMTLHKMSAQLDGGEILLKRDLVLTPDIYIGDVYDFYSKNIPEMFTEVLSGIATGKIRPKKQPRDPERSLRCFPRLPVDGKIDWDRSAEFLNRLVHASSEPFSGAYSFMGTDKLTIWRAHAEKIPYPCLGVPGQVVEIRKKAQEVAILTGHGLLVIEEVGFMNRRSRASKIINSTRMRLGMDIEGELIRLNKIISRSRRLSAK